MTEVFLTAAGLIFLYMCSFFLVSLILKDNSIVDFGWGMGFAFIVSYFFIAYESFSTRQLVVTLLILAWGMRLFLYIFARWIKHKEEDKRYQAWRKEWGKWVIPRSFFQVFMLQGFFMWIISLGALLVIADATPADFYVLDALGVGVAVFGLVFEALADFQLARYKKDPGNKGKTCAVGLWRYSRHPNYFGEAVFWWGIFFIAVSANLGWIGILSPIVITWLLTSVSGVPLLEKDMNKRPDFAEYVRRTSSFIPLPPKKA